MNPTCMCLSSLLLLGAAVTASAQIVPGPDSPVFVPNGVAVTSSGSSGTVLGSCGPTDVLHYMPFFTFSAEKIQTNATLNAILGDQDGDGDHAENFIGGIDAIEVLKVPAPAAALRTIYDYVFSSSLGFSGVDSGSIFRLVPGYAAGDSIEVVLAEAQILSAIGQGAGGAANTDAFAQDATGSIFLSFAADELVNSVLAGDGAIVEIPAAALTYSPTGVVTAVVPGSAVIVLNETDVDAMVAASGLTTATTVGDVSCLAIDNIGKTFIGIDSLPHPNLYFSGESLGPVVLTTNAGGSLATTGFLLSPLGSAIPSPADLGLASLTGGIGAITVLLDTGRPLAIDVTDDQVDYPTETLVEFAVGNCLPNSLVLFLLGVSPGTPGYQPTATQVLGKVYPQLYPFPVAWNLVFYLPTDANGVATLTGTLTHSIAPHVLIGQAYDPGNAFFGFPEQLGAPGSIWFP